MAGKLVSMRNLKFLLYEVFDVCTLTEYDYYKQFNRKTFDMFLDAGLELGTKLMQPVYEEMDRKPPELVDGVVKVHPQVRRILKEFGEGGWIGARFPVEFDGEQLPLQILSACNLIFCAANFSASAFPGMNSGVAHLITSYGDDNLKEKYVAKLLSGQWQGTMAMTEPQAGSSLTDLNTMAEPTDEGFYKITGNKIFISAGDHDCVDNVVHLMLAKIKGGPPGVKGISLFVVPKKRFDENGKLVLNDIVVSQVFHKMGYRGTPTTELSIGENDDCRGYLVGDEYKGLSYMFQMMNEARIGVGAAAAATASAAYYAALEYSRERPQGRNIAAKDPLTPQVPIIEHSDVKRMLLFQKAVVEGSFSIVMQCSKYEDMLSVVSDDEEKEKYALLLDILTPVAKNYPSEMGVHSTSQSIQCFGGYGYCEDFPVEQYYRDMRIHPIHEGTTGIQGMDILGRKVLMKNGKAFSLFLEEVRKTIADARDCSELKIFAEELSNTLERLQEVTLHLIGIAQEKGPEYFLADATLYLELFGIITISWQWLLQSITVDKALQNELSASEYNFYQGKLYTCKYFFRYELPKIEGLAKRLMDKDPLTVEMEVNFFSD
jgi:alkylation response protein AidB-like acyl-CoA dehydrogenase